MEPQDAVKLVFQNEFGGGHLVEAGWSLEYLQKEYESVVRDPLIPLTEDIGNGVVRVNLAALGTEKPSLEALNRVFVRSSELHRGDMGSFLQKLALLPEIPFPFSTGSLNDYLRTYIASGCPMVSHSEAYRRAYRPAYRVVLKSCLAELLPPAPRIS